MHFKVEQLPGRPEFGAVVRDLAPESLSDPATRKRSTICGSTAA